MNQEEILKFNKRCAIFLGWKKYNGINPKYHNSYETNTIKMDEMVYFQNDLKFHSDWNWIHEVIDVIEKTSNTAVTIWFRKEGCTIEQKNGEQEDFYISMKIKTSKKEAVVEAINQFLIWYEKQNK